MARSDFEGTSPKLFWPEILVYLLPRAELNQMQTMVVAIKSETPCEPELLLFAGMNDHLPKELMGRSHIAQAHSTTYHPQTNGLVERHIRTLVNMLRVYCSRYMTD